MRKITPKRLYRATAAALMLSFAASALPMMPSQNGVVAGTAEAAVPESRLLVAVADERVLEEKIERAFHEADGVSAENISVTVRNGVVELTGEVGTPEEIRAAQDIAYAQGALVVDNKLQVPGWGDTIERPAAEE